MFSCTTTPWVWIRPFSFGLSPGRWSRLALGQRGAARKRLPKYAHVNPADVDTWTRYDKAAEQVTAGKDRHFVGALDG